METQTETRNGGMAASLPVAKEDLGAAINKRLDLLADAIESLKLPESDAQA